MVGVARVQYALIRTGDGRFRIIPNDEAQHKIEHNPREVTRILEIGDRDYLDDLLPQHNSGCLLLS